MGITDDSETCEACGKKHLKKVVVLRDSEGNDIKVGTTCASYLMIGIKDKKEADKIAREAKIINSVKKWFVKGYTTKEIASGVFNYYGMSVNSYPDWIIIHFKKGSTKITKDGKVFTSFI